MAKNKIAQLRPKPQPGSANSIPLADVRITLPASGDFDAADRRPVTMSGRDLAVRLAWLERTRHVGTGDDADRWTALGVRLDLAGVSAILLALSQAPPDDPAVFHLLAYVTSDLTSRLGAVGDAPKLLKEAVVTIGAPVAAEAAR